MCGYCVEYSVLTLLMEGVKRPTSNYPDDYFAWFQGGDLLEALETPPEGCVDRVMVICRVLEILQAEGFDSTAYQALLQRPVFDLFIHGFCEEPAPDELTLSLAGVEWLRSPETYLMPGVFEHVMRGWVCDVGPSILGTYLNYRVLGQGLRHNDLNELMETTGVFDPINDIRYEVHETIRWFLPGIWLAMMSMDKEAPRWTLLWDLVMKTPEGIPLFEGLELWLQRRAAIKAYDVAGLTPFLEQLADIRAELLVNLMMHRRLSGSDLDRLTLALSRLPEGDLCSDYFSLMGFLSEYQILE